MSDLARQCGEPLALYELDVSVVFAGPMPPRHNRGAPEVTVAHRAAVAALQQVLRAHGFIVSSTGHGSRRAGTYLPLIDGAMR